MSAIYNHAELCASKNNNQSRHASCYAHNLSLRHKRSIRKLIKNSYFLVDRFGNPTFEEYNILFASEISLKKRERLAVNYLLSWADLKNPFKCFVKVETFGKAIGLKERATQTLLSKLSAMKVIKRQDRGRIHKTNRYALNPDGLIRLALEMIGVVKSEQKTAPSDDKKLHPIKELITHEQNNIHIPFPIYKKPIEGRVKKISPPSSLMSMFKPVFETWDTDNHQKLNKAQKESFLEELVIQGDIETPETILESISGIQEAQRSIRISKPLQSPQKGLTKHSIKRLVYWREILKANEAHKQEYWKQTSQKHGYGIVKAVNELYWTAGFDSAEDCAMWWFDKKKSPEAVLREYREQGHTHHQTSMFV